MKITRVVVRTNFMFGGGLSLYLLGTTRSADRLEQLVQVAKPVEPGAAAEPACDPEPSAQLTREGAQSLMDELWNSGIRPSNAVASTGQIEAMREHVSDLRKVLDAYLHRTPGSVA